MSGLSALYLGPRAHLNSEIAERLGCEMDAASLGPIIRTDPPKITTVPGVFAAGEATGQGLWLSWADDANIAQREHAA